MEHNNEDEKKDKDKKIRLSIINDIFERFDVLKTHNDEENIANFEKKHKNEIEQIREYFKDLKTNEIAYILYLVSTSDEKKFEYIINIY